VRLLSSECVLVGCIEGSMTLRITSPIVKFDRQCLWTSSGRCYVLRYPCATSADMLDLVRLHLAASGYVDYQDITDQVVGVMSQP